MKQTIVGIDWSRDNHQVNIYNGSGHTLAKHTVPQTKAGYETLHQKLHAIEPNPSQCLVAIETKDHLITDYLLALAYPVYVIAPSTVKASRGRQSHAGAKTDDKDAALLADILRTDQHRLLPWQSDSAIVRQIRAQLSFIDDITTAIVRGTNRLEAHLLRYFPQAIDVFSELQTQISLQLLMKYPSPAAVAPLTYEAFAQFCADHGYRHKRRLAERFARLKRPAPFADEQLTAIFADTTPQLVQRLLADVQLKAKLIANLQQLFTTHPDHALYTSIPGTGPLLAPKLLTIFGDHRSRYPSPDIVRALAGTCPVTIQSGKKRSVFFRRGCNKQWRNTFQLLAKASASQSAWADVYVEQARLRGHSKSQAYRCLANRWVGIIWTLWQRKQCYDEQIHLQNLRRYKQ